MDWLPPAYPVLGIEPTTWAYTLTENHTAISWFLDQLSHTSWLQQKS